MFHKEKPDYNRCQYGFYTIDELVPEDHFLRQLESEINFDFIYDLRFETNVSNLFLDSNLRGGCILVKIRKEDYYAHQYHSFR